MFSLYLRGYNNQFLNKVYFNTKQEKDAKREVIQNGDTPFGVADIIEMQRQYLLKKYGSELMQATKVYQQVNLED